MNIWFLKRLNTKRRLLSSHSIRASEEMCLELVNICSLDPSTKCRLFTFLTGESHLGYTHGFTSITRRTMSDILYSAAGGASP